MIERGTPEDTRDWSKFYARTMHLPSPDYTREFLDNVPENGRVLDFGAGSGAWTLAFLRDRPDATFDALDKNIDKTILPDDFKGQRLAKRFEDYRAPAEPYHAIWARSVLFFLARPALEQCFHELAKSLAPKGVIAFTMVDDCHATTSARFHGMSEDAIREMMAREGLELVKIKHYSPPYGDKAIPIPTFDITARRKDCEL